MEPHPSTKMQMFNRHELVCGIISFLCYVGSFCCFCGHILPRKYDWKVYVGLTIYALHAFFTLYLILQKIGCIGAIQLHAEIGRAGFLVGPVVGILALPLLEGEYKNLALFATLLGTISFAFMLMFIAPITTDFGLLNILIGATVKLSWENEDAEMLVWARTGAACVAVLIIRYIVDRAVQMRIAREVEVQAR